jgi:hypothetical protein
LKLLSTRIDTIQETTESRFLDMQTQHAERGQNQLTLILQQGLKEMNAHRNEERCMMAEIRAHQASEPPAQSVLVPEHRSTASSLGDPPASVITTPTTHHSQKSSPSAPDPPEEITPSRRLPKQTSTPSPVTKFMQEYTTPPSTTNKTISTTNIQTPVGPQTIIVQTEKEPKPMNFPSLTSTKGFFQFRAMCLAQSQAHTQYTTLTKINETGTLCFNQNMTKTESSQLFFSTVKALGKDSHLYVSRDLFHTTDGYALWDSLDNHFLRTASSIQSKDNLIADYETTYKEMTESFLQYLHKVENKLEKLHFNNLPTGDLKTQSYKFLRGLKLNHIFGDILMNFDN